MSGNNLLVNFAYFGNYLWVVVAFGSFNISVLAGVFVSLATVVILIYSHLLRGFLLKNDE